MRGGKKRATGQIWQQMYHSENKKEACGSAKGYTHKYTHYNFPVRSFFGSDSHGEILHQKGTEINVSVYSIIRFPRENGRIDFLRVYVRNPSNASVPDSTLTPHLMVLRALQNLW